MRFIRVWMYTCVRVYTFRTAGAGMSEAECIARLRWVCQERGFVVKYLRNFHGDKHPDMLTDMLGPKIRSMNNETGPRSVHFIRSDRILF